MLRPRMSRLLLLAVVLPLMVPADLGGAASKQFDIDIFAVDLAGRQRNLTQDPAVDVAPAVARDERIVFLSTRGGTADLHVMDDDGGNVRRLTTGSVDHSGVAWSEALDISQAAWSPRGERIAFDGQYWAAGPNCEQHCVSWAVLVIGSDGSGLRQIARGARAPAWSPNRRLLAYESGIDAYFEAESVTIMRLDGSSSVEVQAINHDSDIGPVWSPSGSEVAFQARPTDASSSWIYLVRADGRRKRRLAVGHNPAWSPDGRRLAFIDEYKLMTIDRTGKGERRLSRNGEFVVGMAWSPKGGTLGYVAGTKAARYGGLPTNLRVETVSATGKRVKVLLREPPASVIWGDPVWTPDGKRMIIAVEPH
jgi:Tol biopolymer transport system component